MAVVTLEGSGMITSPGIAARALAALADEKINVLMISQGSSEQSICFVVRAAEQGRAVQALEEAFAVDRDRGDVSGVTSRGDVAAVAVVGENMRSRPGISGRMLSTLGRSRINVIAIAQGSSERNISVVVEDADAKRAVQALHEAFPLARRRAHLFVIGTGKMGGALLRLLEEQAPALLRNMSLNLRLVGLANSRRMVWDEEGLPFGDAPGRLDAGEPMDLDRVVQRLADGRLERLVLVDATASAEVARRYPELLEHNVAVVTPNKQANTLDLDFYLRLQQAKRRQRAPYFSETTVGAGLPVISALRDLLRVGDRVLRIEGVMSGTLSFVFDRLHHGVSFSEAVREAREKGYTEPDPREDLSGEDMARKMLILAREMGLQVESKDVRVESLVPKSLLNVPVGEFMERLHEVDAVWAERVAAHQAFGERLQHIGVIEAGQLAARVTPVRQDSPFYALRGADMMVTYTTERYGRTPLVVQGPGARIEITAAGLLADVIKAAELMS